MVETMRHFEKRNHNIKNTSEIIRCINLDIIDSYEKIGYLKTFIQNENSSPENPGIIDIRTYIEHLKERISFCRKSKARLKNIQQEIFKTE